MPVDIITRTTADIITDVKRTFGDEATSQITDTDILRWINNAQLEIVMRSPELLPAAVVINSTEGQADYPLLSNVPDILTVRSVHYKNRPVKHVSFQEAELHLMEGDAVQKPTGEPDFWYEQAGIMTFYPATPETATGSIKVYYNKKPAQVTSITELLKLPDHYYNAIRDFVLEQANLLDEQPQLASVYGTKFEQGVARMQERTQSQLDHYPFITVADEDDYLY